MIKEYLFHGKRKDNGELIEGYYVCLGKKYHYIFTGKLDSANGCFEFEKYEVIHETVGRFTGLTDKNGKKIFEGDLLNGFEYPFLSDNEHNYFAEVVWFDNCPAFGLCTHKHPLSAIRGISDGNCEFMEDFDGSKWEIIGNIFDNPELLEVHNG